MLTILKYLSDVYEYISGGTGDPLCDKIAQFNNKERSYLSLEGSVGVCTINGNYIDKEIKDLERINNSAKKINIASTIVYSLNKSSGNVIKYLGEQILKEGDLNHEFKLQTKFFEIWNKNTNIYVPKPISIKNNVLRMEYFKNDTWKCIEEIENSKEKWKGFLLLKEFFFTSFNKNLLHGDISPFNTLINIEQNKVKICVLDYGLSSEISKKQLEGFNEMTVNSPHQFADELLKKWWKNENINPNQYTDEWLQKLKKNFDLNVIFSQKQLPPESETLQLLAMFVRSILNLSNMAVRYSKFN